MRKRIRKKHNLGEYTRWSTIVRFRLVVNLRDDYLAFLREMLADPIRRSVFQGSSGGGGEELFFLGKQKGGFFDKERDAMLHWLESHPQVSEVEMSPYLEEGRDDYDFERHSLQRNPWRAPHLRRRRSKREERVRRAKVGLRPQRRRRSV